MAKRSSKNKDVISEALLLGFGLMDISASTVQKAFKNLKKNRGITKERSEKAAKDFLKGLEKSRKEVDAVIKRHLKKAIKDLDIATKGDIRRMGKR